MHNILIYLCMFNGLNTNNILYKITVAHLRRYVVLRIYQKTSKTTSLRVGSFS